MAANTQHNVTALRPTPGIANLQWPAKGGSSLPYIFDFGAATSYSIDAVKEMEQGDIPFIQTAWIDNSLNSATLQVQTWIADTPINLTVAPYSQGYYPVLIGLGAARFAISSSGGVLVPIVFLSVAIPYFSWSAQAFNTTQLAYTPIVGSAQYGVTCVAATKLTVPAGATYATVQAFGAAIDYTFDGTTPVGLNNHQLFANQFLYVYGAAALAALQMISAAGTFTVSYFK